MGLLSGIFHRSDDGTETPIAVENVLEAKEPRATREPDPQIAAMQARVEETNRLLEAERAERASEREARAAADREALSARLRSEADADAARAVSDNKIVAAGRGHLASLHAFARLSAAGLPTEGIDPAASLEAFVASLPAHNLTGEAMGSRALPADAGRLDNAARDGQEVTPERIVALLKDHPMGAAALKVLKNA